MLHEWSDLLGLAEFRMCRFQAKTDSDVRRDIIFEREIHTSDVKGIQTLYRRFMGSNIVVIIGEHNTRNFRYNLT